MAAFAAFEARHFGRVWASGLLWHVCRWGAAFLSTWLTNDMTGSPRLVQLAGAVLYAPLLLGGVLGGVVSDRFDRVSTVRLQLVVLVPLTVLIGVLVRADKLQLWMLYTYLFIIGIGWVTDMTSRRALVFELVGDQRLDAAMAMESLSLSTGMVIGALVGGYAIDAVGVGNAWWWLAVVLVLAFVLLLPVESPAVQERPTRPSAMADLRAGTQLLKTNNGLKSILGVTVIANFFVFSYFPIIPVIGTELDVSAFWVGLLMAGTGIGMMTGSLRFAGRPPVGRGRAYVIGVFVALAFLAAFSVSTVYLLALAMIVCSGIGSGFFGSTQSTLVVETVPDEARGRALGLLSMAIGALPVGMYGLGELAEAIDARPALFVSAVTGTVALATWLWRRPEVTAMQA